MKQSRPDVALLLLRWLLGLMFIAHLYWKVAVFPGGLPGWWSGLVGQGYSAYVPAYVLSAEFAGALARRVCAHAAGWRRRRRSARASWVLRPDRQRRDERERIDDPM